MRNAAAIKATMTRINYNRGKRGNGPSRWPNE
jgi:hypothetical protein